MLVYRFIAIESSACDRRVPLPAIEEALRGLGYIE
jgi:hypothetical protein